MSQRHKIRKRYAITHQKRVLAGCEVPGGCAGRAQPVHTPAFELLRARATTDD